MASAMPQQERISPALAAGANKSWNVDASCEGGTASAVPLLLGALTCPNTGLKHGSIARESVTIAFLVRPGAKAHLPPPSDAALKRRSSTNPIPAIHSLQAWADNAVEERPFEGRVAGVYSKAAFRPRVPFWNSSAQIVTRLTDSARPAARPSRNGLRPHLLCHNRNF